MLFTNISVVFQLQIGTSANKSRDLRYGDATTKTHLKIWVCLKMGLTPFLQPDTLSAARETQQGNESTINQRKQEMI